ncbi:hypothetical protein [Rhizobium giardinii]|uniref:hypothetical protein n=1 Tax=Rhizobium giardinii TaxID=56731 RepID=UPI003D6F218E
MPKKTKTPRLSDKDLATIARQFERAFGATPFRRTYSDAEPTFRQLYSDGSLAAGWVLHHNAKSRRRRCKGGNREDG